ncbi:MAG: ferritin [Burkholderiales bacterium]|nr:ferritin [Burkholderiales bacterium]
MTQSVGFHENEDLLDPQTRDRHRAIASLNEEMEAVDWYDQRVQAAHDDELRAILAHNRDEEKEHAAMVLEWLRRHDAKLDEQLRNYLFQQKSPIDREHELEQAPGAADAGDGSLGIGSLREEAVR